MLEFVNSDVVLLRAIYSLLVASRAMSSCTAVLGRDVIAIALQLTTPVVDIPLRNLGATPSGLKVRLA